MASFKAAPIYVVCANHHQSNNSQLGFLDSCLGFNYSKNSCSSGYSFNFLRLKSSPKWECLGVVVSQREAMPIIPIEEEDDKPLLSPPIVDDDEVEAVDQTQITPPPPKIFHRDLNSLPRPLSAKDLGSSPSDDTKVRVAHQGSPGAYSEAAALKAYPNCEPVPCDQFEAVFKAVELWLVDKAVLPIENSVGGSIHRNYDLLIRHRLHIVGEVKLVVNHCLLGLPGIRKEEVKKVRSHPQAIDQCKKMLHSLKIIGVSAEDTGSAAQKVASDGLPEWGAIASPRAAEIYGLDILAERIQDDLDNVTRFLVLAREPIIPGTDRPHKTSIVFTLEEGPGVLFKALAVFALRDIVLTKIESRPQRKRPFRVVEDDNNGFSRYFDYLFYFDFEASMAEPRAQFALRHLQEFTRYLRVLGCYPIDTTKVDTK